MPGRGKPAESIQFRPTPTKIAVVMSALAEADQKIGDYFGETDGRVFLTAFAEKKDTMLKFPPRRRTSF